MGEAPERRRKDMKLKDQVAIITGAGRNIGEDTAKLFAAEGAKVAVVDNHKGRADKVAGDIVRGNGEAAGFVADVSSEADVEKLVKDVVGEVGPDRHPDQQRRRSPTTSTCSTSARRTGTASWR